MILPSRRIYFYKMIKSPKFKSFQMAIHKDKKGYMKNLQDQLNKSRMAVETITTFKNNQMNFKKKIDEIQQQLHSCLSRINTQTKKNVALSELISLLKGQMFQFQKKQKQEEQLSASQSQKRIKKIQYDIEQILQKHNEQIAKINFLKEQANCCRSQRVVFSNLFKKLQKQLKQNEECYKQNLMKSEVARDKNPISEQNYKDYGNSVNDEDLQCHRPTISKKTLFLFENQSGSQAHETFVTLQRHPSETVDQKLSYQRKKKNTQKLLDQNYDKLDIKMTSKGFNEMITSYQTFIEQLKVAIGYSDSKEILDHYEKLEIKNQKLSEHVQAFNNQIIKIQHLTEEIYRQKRSSQCYQYSKDLPLASTRRIKAPTQKFFCQQTQNLDQIMKTLVNLSSILKSSSQQQIQMNEQQLKELDYKLDKIILECKSQKGQSENFRQHTLISEANVDVLLQRMEKFNQCQKLLDLDCLKQEYTKQVGKCKKTKNKKQK